MVLICNFDTQVARIVLFVYFFYHMYIHFDQVSKHLTVNAIVRSISSTTNSPIGYCHDQLY